MDEKIMEELNLWSGGSVIAYPADGDREHGCFPEDHADTSALDTTGHFFSIRKKPAPEPRSEEDRRHVKVFTDNAFLLLANYRRIFSDSRMFLAPVYVRSGLAYSGYLPILTVGGYIELWLNCPVSARFDEDGRMSLVWHISGSPLTGMNSCAFVDEDGNKKSQEIGGFHELRTTFAKIANYYGDAKEKYEAYTLEEVVEILKKETSEEEYRGNMEQVRNLIRDSKLREEK